ncbi:hypothetical protein Q9R08_15415 [Microbacterium sp. QXD-8]|uniref:Uncharacterized protein n=1 Tax=Microbacterium psychrotolerans TaxID=3068321 RepID=A0ABU0Z463_9MICO|nr:hypothetical protein [Microbacterium sp. QXD-8]MDQ7879379.1 hypothetical protein [Microbacterium sp. QXD-8]
MTATLVRTDLDEYRVAMAELPERVAAAAGRAGAVVVVDGTGAWWRHAEAASRDGAAAVVVARPGGAPAEALGVLEARTGAVPIILERPQLRHDAVAAAADALPAPRRLSACTIECHAASDALSQALRDAIGWARVLAGRPLRLRVGTFADGSGLALLETDAQAVVSAVVATQPGAPGLGRLRITALAETVVEVDDDGGDLVMATTDASGRRTLPRRFERPERVALRRAIEAVRLGRDVDDLAELRHDAVLAGQILGRSRS